MAPSPRLPQVPPPGLAHAHSPVPAGRREAPGPSWAWAEPWSEHWADPWADTRPDPLSSSPLLGPRQAEPSRRAPAPPPPSSALDRYREQREAHLRSIVQLRSEPRSDVAATLVSQAVAGCERQLRDLSEGQPPVACSQGCASCCSLRMTATAPELLVMARHVRAVAPAHARNGVDLLGALREADTITRGLNDGARAVLRLPCPLLVQGSCAVYAVRPLACRAVATPDLRACVDAAAGRRATPPGSGAHRQAWQLAQAALLSALTAGKLPWGLAELNQGLASVLNQRNEPDTRWRCGADPVLHAGVPASELDAWRAQVRRHDEACRPGDKGQR